MSNWVQIGISAAHVGCEGSFAKVCENPHVIEQRGTYFGHRWQTSGPKVGRRLENAMVTRHYASLAETGENLVAIRRTG